MCRGNRRHAEPGAQLCVSGTRRPARSSPIPAKSWKPAGRSWNCCWPIIRTTACIVRAAAIASSRAWPTNSACDAGSAGAERVPDRRVQSFDRSRTRQVHPVRQVRARVRRDPACRRDRLRRPRLPHDRRYRLRRRTERLELHQLRSVRRGLPDGGPDRKGLLPGRHRSLGRSQTCSSWPSTLRASPCRSARSSDCRRASTSREA